MMRSFIIAFLAVGIALVSADLPVHCLRTQVAGTWEFELSANTAPSPDLCGYRQPDKSANHLDGTYTYKLEPISKVKVELQVPNIAVTEHGNGTWTMVYDEGFFVQINDMEFFAYNSYRPKKGTALSNIKPENYVSYCHKTLVGWYHDKRKWGCWQGRQVVKAFPNVVIKGSEVPKDQVDYAVVSPIKRSKSELDKLFEHNYALIESVNADSSSTWKAHAHPHFAKKTNRQMLALTGGRRFAKPTRSERAVPSTPVSAEEEAMFTSLISTTEEATISVSDLSQAMADAAAETEVDTELEAETETERKTARDSIKMLKLKSAYPAPTRPANQPTPAATGNAEEKICEFGLPCTLDWRNHKGHNWLSNIRNQGSCGSCYAMALATVAETRIRIAKNDPKRFRLSPQQVLACSVYNQGCDGGYPFLVGKHFEHFGAVSEKCFPYAASDSVCSKACTSAPEFPIMNTHYVGSHYGNCSEEAMMREMANGPISIAFESPHQLFSYRGGIFTGPRPQAEDQQVVGVQPWQHTNHAVVGVGYGHTMVNGKRVKYWICRNTWGKHWGEDGYFRIIRGQDECGIESMSVALTAKP